MGRGKVVVVVSLVAAVLFGIFLGYLAFANDSFPAREARFSDYANVTSQVFNGSEYAFTLTWKSADYTPLYAQVTSASSSGNTPVCELGLASVTGGQSLFMPFAIKPASGSMTSVNLWVAVRANANGTEFTIVYPVDAVIAQQLRIEPSGYACSQPNAPM